MFRTRVSRSLLRHIRQQHLKTHAFPETRRWAHSGASSGRSKTNKVLWLATGALSAGFVYYMTQDVYNIRDAPGAHELVPLLALHPEKGGPKNLPIVSHQLDDDETTERKPRLLILGGGWGGVSVLRGLERDKFNVTVVSDNNYFLFTPLLPLATMGSLELRSLLEPIRKIVCGVRGHFLEGRAVDIDIENKLVEIEGRAGEHFYVPYDRLVVAVGATSITHGVQGLENTVKLKTVQDAIAIRRKIMTNVERACLPTTTPEERKKLLSFVVCGGGPTGVEFAAELFDWINEDLVQWFPKVLREDVSVTIIQSRDHILNTFDVSISNYAEKRFSRENIKVITNSRVVRIDEDQVVYRPKGENQPELAIPYGLCLWSTGIAMTPFVTQLAEKLGSQIHQRVLTLDPFLRVKGIADNSVFALGDCATVGNPQLLEHILEIFEEADKNQDGALTLNEFNDAVKYLRKRFPLTQQHLNRLVDMFNEYDKDKSGTLDLDEMKVMLHDVDSKMTHLPATAQVASQQGKYLAKYLNNLQGDNDTAVEERVGAFHYSHLGALASLGNTAVGEFSTGHRMIGGLWALYMWRSVYWSEQVSMRTRAALSVDWTKRAIWGRDISAL